jgi:hypothetical protein
VKRHLDTLILALIIGATLAAFAASLPECITDTDCGCTDDCLESAP